MTPDNIRLAKLSHTFNLISCLLEHYESKDEECDEVGQVQSAEIAIKNVRRIEALIAQASDLTADTDAEAMPARECCMMAHNAIGQADVPAEFALLNGREQEAIKRCQDAIQRAYERCGHAFETLAAKYGVMAAFGVAKPPAEQKTSRKRRSMEDWLELLNEFESERRDNPELTETTFAESRGILPNTANVGLTNARQERTARRRKVTHE